MTPNEEKTVRLGATLSSAIRKPLVLAAVLVLACVVLSGFGRLTAEARSYEIVKLSTRAEVAATSLNDLGKQGYSLVTVIRSPHDENWAFLMK